jgi:hypothetical protein
VFLAEFRESKFKKKIDMDNLSPEQLEQLRAAHSDGVARHDADELKAVQAKAQAEAAERAAEAVAATRPPVEFDGPKAMEHVRRHSGHARDTAVRMGRVRPDTQEDVMEFLRYVVARGEHRVGVWATLDVNFYRLNDAIVLTRMDGKYLSNMDLSLGGNIVRQWDAARPPQPPG